MDDQEQPSAQIESDDVPQSRRFRPIVVLGVIVLIALIVGGSVFTYSRLTETGGLFGSAPAPTLTPGSNVFYFSASPSWGTISVDGRVLNPLPMPGTKVPPLVLASGAFSPCVDCGLIDQQESCTNGGQSCYTFCSFTDASAKKAADNWDVLMPVSVEWDYSRTNGKAVAQYQPDPSDRQGETFLVALTVKWTGAGWQVSLYHSKTIDQSTIGNPACDAAAYIIGQDARFQSVAGSNQNIYWKYISGPNAAEGCVAEAFLEASAGTASSSQPIASCLYRFGVPLALDNEAHRSWPFLLQASAYEQGIAQQIVAQSNIP